MAVLVDTILLLLGGLILYGGAVRLGRSGDRSAAGWVQILVGLLLAAIGTWRLVADVMDAALG